MFEGQIAQAAGTQIFPEKELRTIVHSHAKVAAIVVGFPAFGLDFLVNIAFIFILWDMYSELCKKANTKLTFGNVLVGIIVNYAFVALLDSALAFLPVIGWLTSAAIVYAQFYFSGKTYIETLRTIYKPSQKTTSKFDIPSKFQVSSNVTPLPESTSKISLPEKPAQQILDALRENQKLLAVKYATELYKLPLKEAKDYIDGLVLNIRSYDEPITISMEERASVEDTKQAVLESEMHSTDSTSAKSPVLSAAPSLSISSSPVIQKEESPIEDKVSKEQKIALQIQEAINNGNAEFALDRLMNYGNETLLAEFKSQCMKAIEEKYSKQMEECPDKWGRLKILNSFIQKYGENDTLRNHLSMLNGG